MASEHQWEKYTMAWCSVASVHAKTLLPGWMHDLGTPAREVHDGMMHCGLKPFFLDRCMAPENQKAKQMMAYTTENAKQTKNPERNPSFQSLFCSSFPDYLLSVSEVSCKRLAHQSLSLNTRLQIQRLASAYDKRHCTGSAGSRSNVISSLFFLFTLRMTPVLFRQMLPDT